MPLLGRNSEYGLFRSKMPFLMWKHPKSGCLSETSTILDDISKFECKMLKDWNELSFGCACGYEEIKLTPFYPNQSIMVL